VFRKDEKGYTSQGREEEGPATMRRKMHRNDENEETSHGREGRTS
jgi:hypothetical protein